MNIERFRLPLFCTIACAAIVHTKHVCAYSTNDIIATYAGNGTAGYSGDGGPAVSAQLKEPQVMAIDAAGNVYLSDDENNVIRKISTSGIITTIAGTGVAGYNGDGIPATTAQLNLPEGLAFDAAGDLYVADSGNHRIRKIALGSGLISTIAGIGTAGCVDNPATAAKFNAPFGLAFDADGNLFISDMGNEIVRKLSGGYVSSFAGTCTQPAFQLPKGLATDSSGDVYVADAGFTISRVWKVDSSGNKTTFAGNGEDGNTGDGSLATASDVRLFQPESVARDGAGNTFIGSGNVVRVVTPDGIIHTSTGNGTVGNSGDGGPAANAQLSDIGGVAVNSAGRLFIVDRAHPVVRIVGPAAPVIAAVAGHDLDPMGDYIASADGRINCPGTGTCGANYVRGMPVILDATQASPDPLYEWSGGGCRLGNTACTLIAQTALPTAVTAYFSRWYIKTSLGGTVGPTLHGPFALAFDAGGNLYFTETTDCVVRKRSTNGTLTTIAGNGICGNLGDDIPANEAELNNPQGVAVDAVGNVYIQDTGNGVIRKVTADGTLHNFASMTYTGSNSPALAINSTGDLFMPGSADTVVRITPDGVTHAFATTTALVDQLDGLSNGSMGGFAIHGTLSGFGGPLFGFVSAQGTADSGFGYYVISPAPAGLAVDRRGDLFHEISLCDLRAGTVIDQNIIGYQVTSQSCGYAGDGGPAALASLQHAVGLAFDSKGFLYVADYGNNAIRELYPDAIFTGDMEQ